MKAANASQNEVLLLAEMHVGRGVACVSNKTCRRTSNWEHDEKQDNFDVAAVLENRRSWSDTHLVFDLASYSRRTPVALTGLQGTIESKCT